MNGSFLTISMVNCAASYPSQFRSISHRRPFFSKRKIADYKYSFRASSQGFKPRSNNNKDVGQEAESDGQDKTMSTGKVVAPRLASNVRRQEKDAGTDDFEKRLDEIKRAGEEKRRLEQRKSFGPIDYDSPPSKPDSETVSFPVKAGIGLGVVIFGLIFAFGDLIPYQGSNVQKENIASPGKQNSDESTRLLKEQLQGFVAILKIHPDDLDALEGAAVTNAELGELSESETLLRHLVEARPTDVEALRLLGEVQSALGKSEDGIATFRQAMQVSPRSITLLKGYVEVLVSQGKQTEAVKELIEKRDLLTSSNRDASNMKDQDDIVTIKQIGLLLGKTYAEWGHVSDAVAVYDSLIKSYPEDFQGYLAKGILLKDQGQIGEADRMFIQARYLAPDKIKPFVDRYSRQ